MDRRFILHSEERWWAESESSLDLRALTVRSKKLDCPESESRWTWELWNESSREMRASRWVDDEECLKICRPKYISKRDLSHVKIECLSVSPEVSLTVCKISEWALWELIQSKFGENPGEESQVEKYLMSRKCTRMRDLRGGKWSSTKSIFERSWDQIRDDIWQIL
jgi:hypothetical protein